MTTHDLEGLFAQAKTDQTSRMILADALEDVGRSEEAAECRNLSRFVRFGPADPGGETRVFGFGFDRDEMHLATSNAAEQSGSDDMASVGYIHRLTGEIIHLFSFHDEAEFAESWGPHMAGDQARERARREQSPDDWLEIPKRLNYPSWVVGEDEDDEADEFEPVREMLGRHGIHAFA